MTVFDGSNSAGQGCVAILGGSAEARALAGHLGDRARLWLPARDRVTGQGASDQTGLADVMQDASVLVVAAHPCDRDTAALGAKMAARFEVPSLTLARPEWHPTRRDRWISVASARDAAWMIPKGARVLVTLGRPALGELRALRHAHVFVRQLTEHHDPFPLKHGRFLFGDAPFPETQECALMRRLRIDAVLTRNAGGPGGWPKIAAARALGLPVYMVARPPVPFGRVVRSVDAAMQWIQERTWLNV